MRLQTEHGWVSVIASNGTTLVRRCSPDESAKLAELQAAPVTKQPTPVPSPPAPRPTGDATAYVSQCEEDIHIQLQEAAQRRAQAEIRDCDRRKAEAHQQARQHKLAAEEAARELKRAQSARENGAIVRIQSAHRVRTAQSELEARRQEAKQAAEQAAELAEAARIAEEAAIAAREADAAARREEERLANEAAVTIQATRRGRRARSLLEEQRQAAVTLQRAARGRQARRAAAQARALRRDAERDAEEARRTAEALRLAEEELAQEQKRLELERAQEREKVSVFASGEYRTAQDEAIATVAGMIVAPEPEPTISCLSNAMAMLLDAQALLSGAQSNAEASMAAVNEASSLQTQVRADTQANVFATFQFSQVCGDAAMTECSGNTPSKTTGTADLASVFAQFDTDSSGSLDGAELQRALRAIGLPESKAAAVFASLDADGSNTITLEEWEAGLASDMRIAIEACLNTEGVMESFRPLLDVAKLFEGMDDDGNEVLGVEELIAGLQLLGLEAVDVSELFEQLSEWGDDQVSLEEWKENLPADMHAAISDRLHERKLVAIKQQQQQQQERATSPLPTEQAPPADTMWAALQDVADDGLEQDAAATMLQAAARGRWARNQLQEQEDAALLIQCMHRVKTAQAELEERRQQALQAAERSAELAEAAQIAEAAVTAAQEVEAERLEEERKLDDAAITIQASRRGARARALLEEQRRAALTVQRAERARQARRAARQARALRRDAEGDAQQAQKAAAALALAEDVLAVASQTLALELESQEKADEGLKGLQVFDRADSDGNATLDRDEMAALARSLGVTSKRQIASIISQIDSNGDSEVSREEFMAWWEAQEVSSADEGGSKKDLLGKLKLNALSAESIDSMDDRDVRKIAAQKMLMQTQRVGKLGGKIFGGVGKLGGKIRSPRSPRTPKAGKEKAGKGKEKGAPTNSLGIDLSGMMLS